MNATDARNTMARYLVGASVPPSELAAAQAAVRQDASFRRYLRDLLTPEPAGPALCEVFAHSAAEYAELSTEERVRRFPRLAEHLTECEECQRSLWGVRPFVARPGGSEATTAWQASTTLCATSSADGEITLARPAPAFTAVPAPQPVGGLLDVAPDVVGRRAPRSWTICDDVRGVDLRLTIAAEAHLFSLRVDVLVDHQLHSGDDLRLEVWDEVRESCQVSGPGSQSLSRNLTLPPGRWIITVTRRGVARTEVWEVPLSLEIEHGQ